MLSRNGQSGRLRAQAWSVWGTASHKPILARRECSTGNRHLESLLSCPPLLACMGVWQIPTDLTTAESIGGPPVATDAPNHATTSFTYSSTPISASPTTHTDILHSASLVLVVNVYTTNEKAATKLSCLTTHAIVGLFANALSWDHSPRRVIRMCSIGVDRFCHESRRMRH